MAKLFQRLATSYSAGLDIRSIYKRESESGGSAYKLYSRRVLEGISQGLPLAESMAKTNGYFPELAVAIIQAGERGGRLEESFARLARHYDSLVKFRSAFLMSIAWPVFELCFSVFVIGMLILIMGYVCDTGGVEHIDWFQMGLSTWGQLCVVLVHYVRHLWHDSGRYPGDGQRLVWFATDASCATSSADR